MASKEDEQHNHTTGSQETTRKRSPSPDANGIASATKKRSIDLHETNSSNQTTDDNVTTLHEDLNTSSDIPNDVTELFEEIDENGTTQYVADSGHGIDIESFETSTYIAETESVVPNPVNEPTQTSAPEPKESIEVQAPTTTEATSNGTVNETELQATSKENRPSDSLPTPTPIDKDTATTSTDNTSTTTQTGKRHPSGLTVPDKSSTVRQPFSDKFFFTSEAYEAYSHDSFMMNIDSIAKKNKPGLALSLERPTSSSVSTRTPQPPPTAAAVTAPHHHNHSQRRTPNSIGTTTKPSSTTTDNKTTPTTTTTTTNNNILDSLLDSISKSDRSVPAKPVHVLSDIEIAMRAADLPQE